MSLTKYYMANEDFSQEEALNDFIKMAKEELEIFGKDLPFDKNMWDITKTVPGKQNTSNRITFSNLKNSKKQNNKNKNDKLIPMREPFLSFSKAYIRYKQGMVPVKSFAPLLASLRLIEEALIDMTQTANPVNLNNDVLNRAIEIGRENFTSAVLYRQGSSIKKIAEFVSKHRISKIPIDWRNPVKRPSDSQRVGKKADDRRNEKMPSQKGLDALAEIFNLAKEPKDLLVSSIVAILLSSPDRIGELLLLQEYCEVIQKDSKGKEQYGLRWYPEKGAEPMIKWIIPSMVDIAKQAIQRIRDLTKQARIVAKWYEENPDMLYLPKHLEYLRGKHLLTKEEVALIIYDNKNKKKDIISIYKTYKIPYEITNTKAYVTFDALEMAILKSLPANFPYINKERGFKYSETLLIQKRNEYNYQKETMLPFIEGFGMAFINDDLGCRGLTKSIFDRFGYTEDDGSPIKITSHQFRHYLNTLAQKGGANQLDIAKWSGRKEVNQNRAYNHLSADDMLQLAYEAVGTDNIMSSQLSNIDGIKKKVVISRDEYAELKVKTAHKTDFGVCIHDFSMMPCQLHMDCLNCTEQICIKGEKESNDRIRQRKLDVEESLKLAIAAQEEGHVGAHRWIKHQTIELEKLTQLCDIFDNENVEDGSLIQMNEQSSLSTIEQAQIRRDGKIEEPPLEFEEMRNLLEDLGDDL